jgi:hypothetical protein
MRLPAGLAFAIGVLAATPTFADCDHAGQMAAEGARVCQGGVVSVCSAHEWLATTLTCPANGSAAPLITPMAGRAPFLIHVLNARYRAGDGATDFVFALRGLCDGKQTCVLPTDMRLLQGSPAARQRGTFNVIYACTTGFGTRDTKQAVFDKGAAETLSCRE